MSAGSFNKRGRSSCTSAGSYNDSSDVLASPAYDAGHSSDVLASPGYDLVIQCAPILTRKTPPTRMEQAAPVLGCFN